MQNARCVYMTVAKGDDQAPKQISNTRDQLPRFYSRVPHAPPLSPYCACHLDAGVSRRKELKKVTTKQAHATPVCLKT